MCKVQNKNPYTFIYLFIRIFLIPPPPTSKDNTFSIFGQK